MTDSWDGKGASRSGRGSVSELEEQDLQEPAASEQHVYFSETSAAKRLGAVTQQLAKACVTAPMSFLAAAGGGRRPLRNRPGAAAVETLP